MLLRIVSSKFFSKLCVRGSHETLVYAGTCQLPVVTFETSQVYSAGEGETFKEVKWSGNAKYLILTTSTSQVLQFTWL